MDETRSLSGARPEPSPELTQWGPFELRQRVGRGGFGEVYRAWDPTLQREVAVKLLLRGGRQEHLQAAILREARAMAKVEHPNIVPIYGVQEYDDRVGMWSAFVRGKTLSELLDQQGAFGARETAHIGVDLCRALSAVHAAGLLHGDIKERNVMREEGGRILLMDFGLTQERDSQSLLGGTPGYIAPELRRGGRPSVRSDLYALGVLLYHLLTKKYPPESEGSTWNLLELRPDLSPDLVGAIHKAVEPDPERRFASAAEMAAALAGEPVVKHRRRLPGKWMAAAAAVIALGAGAYRLRPHSPAVYRRYEEAHDLLQHYYRRDALTTVIPKLEAITRDEPGFAAAFADLGRAQFLRFWVQNDSQAVEPARKATLSALALDPNQAGPHVTLSMLYTQLGKTDLATQEIEAALRIDRLNPEALGAQAELFRAQGRNEEAEAALRQAIDLAPDDWRWHNRMAALDGASGRPAEALAQDAEVVRIAPDNPSGQNNLGLDLRDAGKLEEARSHLAKAVELEPTYRRCTNLGMVLLDLKNYAAAAEMFQRAIGMNPKDYRAWEMLADLHLRRNEKDKAEEAYRNAISRAEELLKTRPKDAGLLADLGTAYASVGDFQKAVPLFRQAVALAPRHGEILAEAGIGYELAGLRTEALGMLERALRAGYKREVLQRNPALLGLRNDKKFLAMLNSLR